MTTTKFAALVLALCTASCADGCYLIDVGGLGGSGNTGGGGSGGGTSSTTTGGTGGATGSTSSTSTTTGAGGGGAPQAGSLLWAESFGDGNMQAANAVGVDAAGNIALAGVAWGAIDFGGGQRVSIGGGDAFAVKLTPGGGHTWSNLYGDSAAQEATAIAVAPNGEIAVAGRGGGSIDFGLGAHGNAGGNDVFVAKLDSAGKALWSTTIGAAGEDAAFAVAIDDTSGDVYAAGSFHGAVWFGQVQQFATGANAATFLARFSASGNVLWARTYGDGVVQSLAVTSGGVVVCGTATGDVDFGGGPMHPTGGGSAFLASLNGTGNGGWSKMLSANSSTGGCAVTPGGDILHTGTHYTQADFGGGPLDASPLGNAFLARYGSNGGYIGARSFGEGAGVTVASTPEGHAVVAGYVSAMVTPTVDFGDGPVIPDASGDLYVARIDTTGKPAWSHLYPQAQTSPLSIASDSAGNTILAGGFFAPLDLGKGPLSSGGASDVFVAKWGP